MFPRFSKVIMGKLRDGSVYVTKASEEADLVNHSHCYGDFPRS